MSLLIKRVPRPKDFGSVLNQQFNSPNKPCIEASKTSSSSTQKKKLKKRGQVTIFELLPPEIVVHILTFLSPYSVCIFSQTNKFNRLFCEDDFLWRTLYQRYWEFSCPLVADLPEVILYNKKYVRQPIKSWKEAFRMRHVRTCFNCNRIADTELTCWYGMRFCESCHKKKFVSKKAATIMYNINSKQLEDIRSKELVLGKTQVRTVNLYYKDDVEEFIKARKEEKKLMKQMKKNKKRSAPNSDDEEITIPLKKVKRSASIPNTIYRSNSTQQL